jgi:hypothetical protein
VAFVAVASAVPYNNLRPIQRLKLTDSNFFLIGRSDFEEFDMWFR